MNLFVTMQVLPSTWMFKALSVFYFLLVNVLPLYAEPPREKMIFKSLGPHGEYITVYSPQRMQSLQIVPGIGCFLGLLDYLDNKTIIFTQKYNDLIVSNDDEDIGILFITTQSRSVRCKIMKITPI